MTPFDTIVCYHYLYYHLCSLIISVLFLGCELQFAGSHFFEGSQYSVSELSLAFYFAFYAYDGW